MKNVLLLSNLNPCRYGSFEELSLFVARELEKRNIRCFLGFTEYPTGEVKRLFDATGATTVRVYCGETPIIGNSSKFNAREGLAFTKFLLKNKIDLIHLNFTGLANPALLGMYLTPAKIIFTEHASGVVVEGQRLRKQVSNLAKRVLLKHVSAYIGVSEYVSRRTRASVPISHKKIRTIYNGVNLSRFQVASKEDARKKLDVDADMTVISAVAMLIPEKGIQCLIQAMCQLRDRGLKKVKLLVVGEGAYRADLDALVEKCDLQQNVEFLGRRSDVHTIFAASDIVVTPSLWDEAFGLSIAEAMACARPVVASNVGGIPELVDSGTNGLLVAPGNVADLVDKLTTLIENPVSAEQMGRQGREKALQLFSLENQVKKIVDLYEEILD